jgi:hypothetical protein
MAHIQHFSLALGLIEIRRESLEHSKQVNDNLFAFH